MNTPETLSPHPPKRSWTLWLVLTALLSIALFFLGFALGRSYPRVPPMYKGLPALPESERPLDGAVLGLEARRADLAMMPVLRRGEGATPEDFEAVQRQLYQLFTRCAQGGLMAAWPKDTKVRVGVPDPQTTAASQGGELECYEDYLKEHCGWSPRDIDRNLQPFPSAQPLIWTQDIGEIVERPGSPLRTVYHSTTDANYRSFVTSLAGTDPSSLAELPLPAGLSCEGGDLEVSWAPGGKTVLLLGRHRVLAYLKTVKGFDGTKQVPSVADVEEAKAAFSAQFDMPVQVVPEEALYTPHKACSELFHLDMVVSVIDPHDGQSPRAFVPELTPGRVADALFDRLLDPGLEKSCRWELEAVARQMASLGYKVVRLPFSDHPVRTPANFVKYRDPHSGKYMVLLSKFPAALPRENPNTPQRYFNAALSQLRISGEFWQRTGSPAAFQNFQNQLANTWRILDFIESAPNPLYSECARRIEAEGIEVTAVPSFAFGSGGMHCQVLK